MSNTLNNQTRLNYIDVCKAFGIILVVLGHTYGIPYTLDLVIVSFHMPLFFIISGYLYDAEKNKKMNFRSFVLKKAKQYLLPYFALAGVNFLIQILWRLFYTHETLDTDYFFTKLRGIIFCYSDEINLPNCTPIWFLVCLFISLILFWLIMKLPVKFQLIPIVFGLIINYLVTPYWNDYTSFPWKFPTFLVGLFFIFTGYYFRRIMELRFHKNKWLITGVASLAISGSIAFVVLSDNFIIMNENKYGDMFVFFSTSILISSAVVLLFSIFTCKKIGFFNWIGRNTIFIMGFNYLCRDLATELYYYIPWIKSYKMHWAINFIMTFCFCIFAIIICNKFRLGFTKMLALVKASKQ